MSDAATPGAGATGHVDDREPIVAPETGDAATYIALAYELSARGSPSEAIAMLDHGLRSVGIDAALLTARGELLNLEGRWFEAREALTWALAIDAERIDARLALARALGSLGLLPACIDQANEVLARDPERWEALYDVAEASRLLGDFDRATEVTDRLLASYPDNPDLHRLRTLTLAAQGRTDDAIAAASAWEVVAPLDPRPRLERAAWLRNLGRSDEADAAFDAALAVDPDNVEALLGKAGLISVPTDTNDLERRLELIDRALRIEPGHRDALQRRAYVLWLLDRNGEAIDIIDGLQGTDALDAALLGILAEACHDAGRYDRAADAYTRLVELVPVADLSAVAAGHYVTSLRMTDRRAEARAVIDAVATIHPDDGLLLSESAELHRLDGDDESALADLDRALAAGTRTAFVLGTKGQVLTSLGRAEDALPVLAEAIALSTPNEPVWVQTAHGDAFRALGRMPEAIKAYDRALEIRPDDFTAEASRCEAVRSNGDPATALEIADRLLQRDPSDVFTRGTRAAALVDLERPADALDAITPLLESEPDYYFGLTVRVRALEGLDRCSEALDAVDRVLSLSTDDGWAIAAKALMLLKLGRTEAAFEFLSSNPLDPEKEDKWNLSVVGGLVLARLDRLPEAARRLSTPRDPDISCLEELADVTELLGDRDAAVEIRRRAVTLLPQDRPPDSYELASAAWCSFLLGDNDAAARRLSQALAARREVQWFFSLGLVQAATGPLRVVLEQLQSWRDALAACPDADRAFGIVKECRVLLTRAERFRRIPPERAEHRAALEAAVAEAERIHGPVRRQEVLS
jgi:tetratricopeptide (TPR) repeat protein